MGDDLKSCVNMAAPLTVCGVIVRSSLRVLRDALEVILLVREGGRILFTGYARFLLSMMLLMGLRAGRFFVEWTFSPSPSNTLLIIAVFISLDTLSPLV
jgi:hypothetical protein